MTTVTPAVLSEHDLSAYDGWCQSQADGAPPNSDIANLVTAYRALKQERDQLRQAAQQAAQIFSTIRDQTYVDAEPPELRGQNECNYRRANEALAAFAKVGIQP